MGNFIIGYSAILIISICDVAKMPISVITILCKDITVCIISICCNFITIFNNFCNVIFKSGTALKCMITNFCYTINDISYILAKLANSFFFWSNCFANVALIWSELSKSCSNCSSGVSIDITNGLVE